jgi:tRNA-modifying protein YgfZ
MPDLNLTTLDNLSVLTIRGADAHKFLQGQVSQDISRLEKHPALWAGLHNPQGRVIAVLRLFGLGSDQVLAILPTSMAIATIIVLQRYLLRAKAVIEDGNSQWCVYGLTGPDAEAAASTRLHMPMDASGFRQLVVAPRAEPVPEAEAADLGSWTRDDIAQGLPEVLPETSGLFVAQMLNLDLIDAVSFTKGCYTGQEIIARAHYRGKVKRRMQRFGTDYFDALKPGERVLLSDGREAKIVQAAFDGAGGQEFLAVAGLATIGELPAIEDSASSEQLGRVNVIALPLSYAYPA